MRRVKVPCKAEHVYICYNDCKQTTTIFNFILCKIEQNRHCMKMCKIDLKEKKEEIWRSRMTNNPKRKTVQVKTTFRRYKNVRLRNYNYKQDQKTWNCAKNLTSETNKNKHHFFLNWMFLDQTMHFICCRSLLDILLLALDPLLCRSGRKTTQVVRNNEYMFPSKVHQHP